MNTGNASKTRIRYIDIAKGILICCLLYGHMLLFARMEGLNDSVMKVMQQCIPLYNCFFMQSFFFITGLCSSFDKDFKGFLWRNTKSLLIPSVILVTISEYCIQAITNHSIDFTPIYNLSRWFIDGGPWFIITMFLGKVLYFFISKLSIRNQLCYIIVLYLIGIVLNVIDCFPNYWYHRHVLLMLPYLFLGHYCKNQPFQFKKYLFPIAIFGVITIALQFVLSISCDFYKLPTHDYYISINRTFPIHIVNAISGTAFIMWLSQKIGTNRFLETMGQGTLLIYLWNELVNRLILRVLPIDLIYDSNSILSCLLFHFLVLSLLFLLFFILIKIVYNCKSLSWLVGKW